MTAEERAERTRAADELCRTALDKALAGAPSDGIALVAVGGYGRGELAPRSDLDVVLVHLDPLDSVDTGEVAGEFVLLGRFEQAAAAEGLDQVGHRADHGGPLSASAAGLPLR